MNEPIQIDINLSKIPENVGVIEYSKGKTFLKNINIDALKTKTIGEAGMPVIGLGFNETGVTFEEIPLSQRSSAEQRKISMSIGMAMNPDLKVLWLKDASLLDSDSIVDVKTMANENGYQVWLECVGDDKNVGIYIEDGAVVT